MQILKEIVVFILDVKIWGGRKKLLPDDLALNGIDTSKLPPGTLASLGSKRIIAAETLAPFTALKREAEKLCLAQGVRFIGGYAVRSDNAADLSDGLEQLQSRFDKVREELLLAYDTEVEKWIKENPAEWEPIIRAAIEPASYVEQALQFSFCPVKIDSPDILGKNLGLEQEASGLYGQLCHEIRVAARTAFETSFAHRSKITRKALRPIYAMRQKLSSLSFIDPSIGDTIAIIDDTLARLPAQGPIEGADLNMVAGLVGRQLAHLGQPIENSIPDEKEMNECEVPPELLSSKSGLGSEQPLRWDF